MRHHLFALLTLLVGSPGSGVVLDWVLIANPGNAPDPNYQFCGTGVDEPCGAVASPFRIGKFEITNAQYTEFLNAVADDDPNALYSGAMGDGYGGITRSGTPSNYSYSAISGRENMPVNFVNFYDAMRFVNWLHNGQGFGDTETGAYTITEQGIADNSIPRNVGAKFFVPSENEWYKAAYYDAQSASYFAYPAGSDTPTTCASPTASANHANCGYVHFDVTDRGSYPGSPSPYGTFDQGGNVWEWNETIITSGRGARGGGWGGGASQLSAASTSTNDAVSVHFDNTGFRVAPEPDGGLLLSVGALGVLALSGWRRTRAVASR